MIITQYIFRIILVFVIILTYRDVTIASTPDSIVQAERQLDEVTGKQRIHTLLSLANYYRISKTNTAQSYANQALALAKTNKLKPEIRKAHMVLGNIYKFMLNYEKSLWNNLSALNNYAEICDSSTIASLQYRISENYLFLRKTDSALYYNTASNKYFIKTRDTSGIIKTKIQLGKIYCMDDENIEALKVLKDCLNLIALKKSRNKYPWALYWLGYTNMKLGNFEEAKENFTESIRKYIDIDDAMGKVGSEQALGDLYLKIGEYANAYKIFFRAYNEHLNLRDSASSSNYNSQFLINMGNLYFNIGDYNKSLDYFDSARIIAINYQFESKIALANLLAGHSYFHKYENEKALELYNSALKYYEKSNNKYAKAEVLNKIGEVNEQEGLLPKAIKNYEQAAKINEEIQNKFGLAQNYLNLASCFHKSSRLPKMLQELKNGMPYATEIGINSLLLEYYKLYIDYSDRTGQHHIAHDYFNMYVPLSLKNNTKIKQDLTSLLIVLQENELSREKRIYEQQLEISQVSTERDKLRIRQLVLLASLIALTLFLIGFFLLLRIRMTRKLEQQVDERTKTLQEKEKKIIEISQTKDRFYSIIAHDLKSPFNSLLGFSNLLNDDYDDFTDEERIQFINIIRNSSEEIFALLENLLDWTRKSSENITFKPAKLDLHRIMKQTIQIQIKNAELKNIEIDNKIPKNTFVHADENMLRTIIRNLTSNAIKFTRQFGSISISSEVNESMLSCSFTDTGIGMSQKTMDQLFDITSKVKKKGTANEKGTGLGLLLCKDFVERNGGTLSVESTEGDGSTFTFTLPIK